MNISLYSTEIQELISQMFEYANAFDKRAFQILKKLEKIAKDNNDSSLLGFVYHNYAGIYYDHNNHEKSFYYIQKALYELFISNDRELIARTYNLFAIEAQRLGCYDIAYQYYQLCLIFLDEVEDSYVKGIVTSNTGDLLKEMAMPKKANTYIKESISLFKQSNNPAKEYAIFLVETGLALHYIYTNEISKAKKLYEKLEKDFIKLELENDIVASKWMILIKANLSLINFDKNNMNKEIIDNLINPSSVDYAKDIIKYTHSLIEYKEFEKAKDIILSIENNLFDALPTYLKHLFLQLKVSYYYAINDKNKMLDSYSKRNVLDALYHKEKDKINYESICLMRIIDKIQDKQNKIEKENEKLQILSETDNLTNIPNRNALNRILEEKFNKAYENQYHFGIGVIDIDSFKLFNDIYGHIAGDECLKSVASILSKIGKENDFFVARYGGDEFVLIYENMSDKEINDLEKEIMNKIEISVSHGFHNEIPNENSRPWDFFGRADELLFAKKRK